MVAAVVVPEVRHLVEVRVENARVVEHIHLPKIVLNRDAPQERVVDVVGKQGRPIGRGDIPVEIVMSDTLDLNLVFAPRHGTSWIAPDVEVISVSCDLGRGSSYGKCG